MQDRIISIFLCTHEIEPMGLLGGEVGLEKHSTPPKKKLLLIILEVLNIVYSLDRLETQG